MEQFEDVEAPPHAAAADDRTRCSFNEDANDTWHTALVRYIAVSQ